MDDRCLWMGWIPTPQPIDPNIVCFHCGNQPVEQTWNVNGIVVGICAVCSKTKPGIGTRKIKKGCEKCDYTGFAYGKIQCECSDGN